MTGTPFDGGGAASDAAVGSNAAVNAFERLSQRSHELSSRVAVYEKVRGLRRGVTWSELEREVIALSTGLRQRGFRPGDAAVVLGETRPHLLSTVLAVHALGGVVVPLHPRESLAAVGVALESVRPAIAFVDEGAQLENVAPFVGGALRSVLVDSHRGLRHWLHEGVLDYGALRDAGGRKAERFVPATAPPSAAAFVLVRVVDGVAQARAVSHEALASVGDRLGRAGGLGTSDDVVAGTTLADADSALVAWAAWLSTGFTLHTAERAESAALDTREVGPTALFASAAELEELVARTTARVGAEGTVRRRLLEWALGIAAGRVAPVESSNGGALHRSSLLTRSFARALVLAPLADRLGASRLRVVFGSGPNQERVSRFLSGLAVDFQDAAVPWAPSSDGPLRGPLAAAPGTVVGDASRAWAGAPESQVA